jgi:hypothetical protein
MVAPAGRLARHATPRKESGMSRRLSAQPHLDTSRGRWAVTQRDGNPYLWYRIVVWNEIGRELDSDEQIHHINGDSTDDRVANLTVLSPAAHTRLHIQQRPSRKVTLSCVHCGDDFERYPSVAVTSRFCSRRCRNEAQGAGTFLTGRALRKARLAQS